MSPVPAHPSVFYERAEYADAKEPHLTWRTNPGRIYGTVDVINNALSPELA